MKEAGKLPKGAILTQPDFEVRENTSEPTIAHPSGVTPGKRHTEPESIKTAGANGVHIK